MERNDWKVEFETRRVVILAESERTRTAILARHDSAEAASAELDALDEYTAGRLSGARRVAMRRTLDAAAPSRNSRTNTFRDELEARRSAIFSEQRRACNAIYAKHDSYEAARSEVLATLEYNRGRLSAARDEIAAKYGLPSRHVLRERVYEARVQVAGARRTARRSATSATETPRRSAR